jgi:hypothetical protein
MEAALLNNLARVKLERGDFSGTRRLLASLFTLLRETHDKPTAR